jgi:hypothetical protein
LDQVVVQLFLVEFGNLSEQLAEQLAEQRDLFAELVLLDPVVLVLDFQFRSRRY